MQKRRPSIRRRPRDSRGARTRTMITFRTGPKRSVQETVNTVKCRSRKVEDGLIQRINGRACSRAENDGVGKEEKESRPSGHLPNQHARGRGVGIVSLKDVKRGGGLTVNRSERPEEVRLKVKRPVRGEAENPASRREGRRV